MKHKLYVASGSVPPPYNEKFWVCTWLRLYNAELLYDEWMMKQMEWNHCGLTESPNYCGICLEWLRKTMKVISQDNQSSD